MDSHKMQLLKKLQALAERGSEGERQNAQAQLEKLMEKYGIREQDLEAETAKMRFFPYKHEHERRILSQVIYMVTGKPPGGTVGTYTGRPRKKLSVLCTDAEAIEIDAAQKFYFAAFEEELQLFYSAFARKNNLYPPPDKDTLKGNLADLDLDKALRVSQMASGMRHHVRRKMLNSPGDEEV